MKMWSGWLAGAVAAVVHAGAVAAAEPAQGDDAATARAVVEDFHRALAEGYREGVLRLVDPRVVIFETGYVDVDRDNYAGAHLDNDLLYAAQVKREVIHSEATVTGDIAVVLTQSRNAGEFLGAKLDLENTETMVLRRGSDGWKIVHIHWSGHERAPAGPDTH
ncbi:nuclear transport factor 2 family protein [Fontimonas sp. SYSU GA230001]|uniref:YybH family protein n=1 Tax=Fontimonas sp. SYSU GA230001 TaxID=3142450 RepID=UPI0032B40535